MTSRVTSSTHTISLNCHQRLQFPFHPRHAIPSQGPALSLLPQPGREIQCAAVQSNHLMRVFEPNYVEVFIQWKEREKRKGEIKPKCKSVKGLDAVLSFFLIKSKMRGEFKDHHKTPLTTQGALDWRWLVMKRRGYNLFKKGSTRSLCFGLGEWYWGAGQFVLLSPFHL